MSNEIIDEIDWCKGGRKYIHATDLVPTALQTAHEVTNFEFSSRKVALHPVKWVKAGLASKEDIVATFNGQTETGEWLQLVAEQNLHKSINKSKPFDEEVLIAASVINGNRIDSSVMPGFTIWEHISSLHKHLLGNIFNHPAWWFVRLEGNRHMRANAKNISICYVEKKRILYRSEILIDGQYAGMIDFAMR